MLLICHNDLICFKIPAKIIIWIHKEYDLDQYLQFIAYCALLQAL